ncbi:hypothetical protein EMIHUDRAFT_241677 [Emiliania huxleyi CCMP1516]|uniref:DNA primase/nucleoside triphosphatase C-terminal domain-containing protein n=2 Tax=Emiliania huxleyi TaxID=2903 RepID=A0A0D3JBI5_EMIH1|nr:hypothetical protein EMIHUDRAFT_241677 [Emiliania huxleyi CCMP1516]EOD20870.1 hypothetical protein EMIHUDRAFT_241677 [Emiliania huxleyi CCMP1516]|eukprot:XP_005773299.1 hypothetical protein EMIHUDRAFT_241677 [Emiliania huxleyi CCMP1516]
MRLAASAREDSTTEGYARHWREFEGWCDEEGLDPLPATPQMIFAYPYLSAINSYHADYGFDKPALGHLVTAARRGMARGQARCDTRDTRRAREAQPLEPASGRTNRERLALVARRRPPDGAGARRPKRNYGKNRTPPADERSRNWSAAPARGVRETGLGALFCEQGFPPGGGCGGEPAWEPPAPTQGVPLPGAASGARQGRVLGAILHGVVERKRGSRGGDDVDIGGIGWVNVNVDSSFTPDPLVVSDGPGR